MAILVAGGVNSRQLKGKVGETIFKVVNNNTVVAPYQPRVRNPRTKAQVMVRRKFIEVNRGSRNLYERALKMYGIKLNGHSAYTSVNRMVFNNNVVKSVGYPNNFLPTLPKNNQRLVGCNTDLSGEIFNYLAFRYMKIGNSYYYYVGFSIPKGLFGVDSAGQENQNAYFGTNLSLSRLYFYLLLNGIHLTREALNISDFEVNERYGVDDDNTILGTSADAVGGAYKYTFKALVVYAHEDPANSDNFFFTLLNGFTKDTFGLDAEPTITCYWPGVDSAPRIGATMLLTSKSQEGGSLTDDDTSTSFLARQLMLIVNDYSVLHTIA